MQTRRAAPPGAENLKPLDRCRRRKGGAGVNLRVRERSRARIRALSLKGLVTDAAGTAVENTDYLPFGEEILVSSGDTRFGIAAYGSSGLLRHKFTGKERDSESGMDYFLARYYSGPMGRFTSPDAPLSDQFAAPPQSWNLYAYVRNNPLGYVDPSGRACSSVIGNTGSGFCQRATRYGIFDADTSVRSKTRFFAAASAVSQALANVDGPSTVSRVFVSEQTGAFLEGIGHTLEQLNNRAVVDVMDGSLSGSDLDERLVNMEQTRVQDRLDGLREANPAQYQKTIEELNGALNPGVLGQVGSSLFSTDRAYGAVLDGVRKDLGRDIDFSRQSDREAIGNALVKHIRQTGGCDVGGDKIAGC